MVITIFYLVTLVIVITIHEFSHAWMGYQLGDMTAKNHGRLSLNPVVHIDPFMTLLLPVVLILVHSPVVFGAAKPVPFNPYLVRHGKAGAALVAFAGPASNFLMAFVAGLFLRFSSLEGLGGQFLIIFVLVNLAFFVFNLIPIPPLDGSRLIYAIAPPALEEVMERIEHMGVIGIFLILLVFYSLLGPFMATIVGGLARLIIGANVI